MCGVRASNLGEELAYPVQIVGLSYLYACLPDPPGNIAYLNTKYYCTVVI